MFGEQKGTEIGYALHISIIVGQFSHCPIQPTGIRMRQCRSVARHAVLQSHIDCRAKLQSPVVHVVGTERVTDVLHRPRNELLWHTIPTYRYATPSSRWAVLLHWL